VQANRAFSSRVLIGYFEVTVVSAGLRGYVPPEGKRGGKRGRERERERESERERERSRSSLLACAGTPSLPLHGYLAHKKPRPLRTLQ